MVIVFDECGAAPVLPVATLLVEATVDTEQVRGRVISSAFVDGLSATRAVAVSTGDGDLLRVGIGAILSVEAALLLAEMVVEADVVRIREGPAPGDMESVGLDAGLLDPLP